MSVLPAAIEALYRTFAQYTLAGVEFCTFCHDADRIRAFTTTPLRQLDAELVRVLLWESGNHWTSDAVYKHFLPRLLELMAPPNAVEPLYPLHPYEVLCGRDFRFWPQAEQRAVRDYVAALGDEQAADFLGPSFEPCAEISLQAHCPARIEPRAWAVITGYAGTLWPNADEPPGELSVAELLVRAPFAAKHGEVFYALWEPRKVANDGWEATDGALLPQVRIVECRLLSVLARSDAAHGQARLLVEVRTLADPAALVQRAPPVAASLDGLLLEAGPGVQKHLVRGEGRLLVETTMQGDINFGLLLTADATRLVLLTDTSICRRFFWAGHGLVSAAEQARLAKFD